MKALVLNGARVLRDMGDAVQAELSAALRAGGHTVATHDLTSLDMPRCNGDFGCWTVTPGVCLQHGPHRPLAAELIQSDLVVCITPVTFGGYSSALKVALDHCVPLVSPWFTTVEGETHHVPRYERFPDLLVVGLMEEGDAGAEAVFARLVRRNVLNLYAPRFAGVVLTRRELPGLSQLAGEWLEDVATSLPPAVAAERLPIEPAEDLLPATPGRVHILVGSPRGGASVSSAISAHLAALLEQRGVWVDVDTVGRRLKEDPGLRAFAAGLRPHDVVVLAAPLYVDSLPAPVTEALEGLALARSRTHAVRARLAAIVNCGFPEAVHTDTAVAICRQFCRETGLDWAGGLGVGGGGMLGGGALADMGTRARAARRALALTANALAVGHPLPQEARNLVRHLPVPAWLYRAFAHHGFRREARRHGVLRRVGARPYAIAP